MKTLLPLAVVLGTTIATTSCESTSGSSHQDGPRAYTHTASPARTGATTSNAKPYPLDVCLVSDEELESMGGAITKVFAGQEVKFCCRSCVREFDSSPLDYLRKLP